MSHNAYSLRTGTNFQFLIICDHASNALPPSYGTLGLAPQALDTHIAYDPGAREVSTMLAERIESPLIMTQFSRLLIDSNRGIDDPTLIVSYSDGMIIPHNRDVNAVSAHSNAHQGVHAERQHRIDCFYTPYDDAIGVARAHAHVKNIVPIILSVHSFTPKWNARVRPWHAGVLWDKDPRLAAHFFTYMATHHPDICLGNNQPYTGRLKNDTLYRHATRYGLPHAIIELRQDLIASYDAQRNWAHRLADILTTATRIPQMKRIKQYGSMTD